MPANLRKCSLPSESAYHVYSHGHREDVNRKAFGSKCDLFRCAMKRRLCSDAYSSRPSCQAACCLGPDLASDGSPPLVESAVHPCTEVADVREGQHSDSEALTAPTLAENALSGGSTGGAPAKVEPTWPRHSECKVNKRRGGTEVPAPTDQNPRRKRRRS